MSTQDEHTSTTPEPNAPILWVLGQHANWVIFLGVMNFVACGLFMIAGIVLLITPFGYLYGMNLIAVLSFIPQIGVMIVSGCLLVIMAREMRRYLASQSATLLESVVRAMRNYFRFTGIVTIISIALGLAGLLLSLVSGRMTALNG